MISRFVIRLALAALVAGSAWSQSVSPSPTEPPMRRAPPPPHRIGGGVSVPIQLIDGLPTVAVQINGRGPFRFVVDTGQPFSLAVAPDALDSIGLRSTGEMLAGDPSGGTPHRIPTFEVGELVLGGMTFSKFEGSAAAMSKPGVAGTIGMALFDGLMLTIDYNHLRLTAEAATLPLADGKEIVDATFGRMGLISIPISVGATTHIVDLDTGNGRFPLILPADQIATLPIRGPARDIGVARTISRQVPMKAVDLTAPVLVGSTQMPIAAVAYPTIVPVGNLGSLGLAGMTVTIDMVNQRVRIVKR